MDKISIKKKTLKALVVILELLASALLLYLMILPFYPLIQYKLLYEGKGNLANEQDMKAINEQINEIKSNFPESDYAVSPNRLIIKKIGVNAPIVEAKNADYGLSKGAWRLPESSTPEKGGNTVITGHRFKYLPPNNLTFYLFHKLEIGDIVAVIWNNKNYFYKIREIKTVPKNDLSILKKSTKPILTLFTCDPIYSEENRLVVMAEPMIE